MLIGVIGAFQEILIECDGQTFPSSHWETNFSCGVCFKCEAHSIKCQHINYLQALK